MTTENLSETINPYVTQLSEEGWCVLEGVIPADVVDSVREEVETSEADYSQFSKDNGRWERNVISFMPHFAGTSGKRTTPLQLSANYWDRRCVYLKPSIRFDHHIIN